MRSEFLAFTVQRWVQTLQVGLAMLVATVGLFLALMATSTLFPQMLHKGSIDLLLCRPISRWRIATARFAGGVGIMAFNAAYLFLGVWLVLGLKSDIWTRGFPLSTFLGNFCLCRIVLRCHDGFCHYRKQSGGCCWQAIRS